MNRKLIVIEGQDNTGKDTCIAGIEDFFKKNNMSFQTVHCVKPPKSLDNIQAAEYQDKYNMQLVSDIIKGNIGLDADNIILNRSWYDEAVYGVFYRGRGYYSTLKVINNIEQLIIDSKIDLYYVQLVPGVLKSVKDDDDGNSLHNGDMDNIKQEAYLFSQVFLDSVAPNKILVKVHDINGQFFPKEQILKNILEKIFSKK